MKILIVSENGTDVQILRKVVRNIIPKAIIVTAVNKAQTTEIVCNDGPFSFYIMDTDIKSFSIADVIKTLSELSGITPILYTGVQNSFNASISDELYREHEVNQYFPKPYGESDFREKLEAKVKLITDWIVSQTSVNSIEQIDPQDFIAMKIKNFYLFDEFGYDIYLEITNTRYLKLLPAKTKYGHSFLAKYARRNVKFLHIKKDDHLKYLEEEADMFLQSFANPNLDDDPFIILLRSVSVFHQYLKALGVTKVSIKLLDHMVDYTIKIQQKFGSISSLLSSYPYYYEGISSKSILSAFISLYAARAYTWDSESTKRKLIASAILQDTYIEDDSLSSVTSLKDSKIKELSEEELEAFKSHTIDSANVSEHFTTYPDISFLVMNQHEVPSKRGFPHKPAPNLFNRLSLVFNIAIYIASKIDGQSYETVEVGDHLKMLKKDYHLANGKEVLEIYKKVFRK